VEVIGKGSTNGINLSRFSSASLSEQKISETKEVMKYDPSLTYILSIGRIVKDKGIAEVARVFDRLHRKNGNLRLVLVGEFEEHLDPLDADTMALIKTHPAIILAGWHDEVEYFLHLANVLVHASYREGFPNVLLQAGAMKCPIVCSRIPGNIDIVDHYETGLIFNVRDEEDLYHQLEEAISEKEKMSRMAESLRKKIEENFDTMQVRRFLEEKYLSILGDSKAKP
jgi:glycosyltransferase involved in cell wall biosynthesis